MYVRKKQNDELLCKRSCQPNLRYLHAETINGGGGGGNFAT